MATAQRDTPRLCHGLTQIRTTALGGVSNFLTPGATPMSAVTLASAHPLSARATSGSFVPYNPQQWFYPGPDRPPVFPEDSQPPPPPYSPPRSSPTVTPSHPINAPVASRTLHSQLPQWLPPDAQLLGLPPPPPTSRDRRLAFPVVHRSRDHNHSQLSPAGYGANGVSRTSRPRPSPVGPLTIQIPSHGPSWINSDSLVQHPPAAQRSASAGPTDTPTSSSSQSASGARWPLPRSEDPHLHSASTMRPLVKPRSQSIDSPLRSGRHRPVFPPFRPGYVSSLEPIPPTPMEWIGEPDRLWPSSATSPDPVSGSIHAEGFSISSLRTHTTLSEVASTSSALSGGLTAGLNRSVAIRHDKPTTHRRIDSIRGHCSSQSSFPPSAIGPTQEMQKANPAIPQDSPSTSPVPLRSASYAPDAQTARFSKASAKLPRPDASFSDSAGNFHSTTTQLRNLTPMTASCVLPSTPPFSPKSAKLVAPIEATPALASRTSPTSSRQQSRSASRSHSRIRSSFDQHLTNTAPLALITDQSILSHTAEQFSQGSVERCREFARREAAAKDDAERVRLFTDFMVSESRIRRERYHAAIAAMGSEILDLTRDLFRPMGPVNSRPSLGDWTPHPSDSSRSHRASLSSVAHQDLNVQIPTPRFMETPQPPSPGMAAASGNFGRSTANFMPSLSPILSQSISDNLGDQDSRGRPASRWWETGANSGRTEKEWKYMGLPREMWTEAEADLPPTPALGEDCEIAAQRSETAAPLAPHLGSGGSVNSTSVVETPVSPGLDISRLISLPPPYPRHHPAVNNSHPELAMIRASVRGLNDLSEVDEMRETFLASSRTARGQHSTAEAERRQALGRRLREDVASEKLSYAGAAALEQEAQQTDRCLSKELEKHDYERFHTQVVTPLHELLTSRIERADILFDGLAGQLFDPVESTADAVQEEGDDKPELLEKLTLLKWIFEARETLHRAVFGLLSERNDRYREVIVLPYRVAGNAEKLKTAELLFSEDEDRRQLAQAKIVLERTEAFQAVVERAVVRGVEAQLSAFWDIAPPLSDLLDKVPDNLAGFTVQVPAAELAENAAYGQHPLQYLFGLVAHTEKSAYQFIEAQTNLMCLLHEAKEAVTHAKVKIWEREPPIPAPAAATAPANPADSARSLGQLEQRRLTDELQERVREVQSQWRSALGDNVAGVKEHISDWLLQTGGWDEALEDAGVGVA